MRGPSLRLYCCTNVQLSRVIMRHRAPLTAARLAAIYDACPEPMLPIVLELLWEIHRLRATALRANQIRIMIGDGVGSVPRPV